MKRADRCRAAGLILAVCALVAIAGPLTGQGLPLTSDRGPRFSHLTVVLDDSYPPYAFREEGGALQGILVDKWHLWEKKTGVPVTLIGTDWDKAPWLMERGDADVIDPIFRSHDVVGLYDFSRPYARIQVQVFFPREIGGITNDPRSLRGFTIGVRAGDEAVEFLRKAGITAIQEFPTYDQVVEAAAAKRIRVFCMDQPPALYYLYKLNLEGEYRRTAPLIAGQLHWAVHKGDSEMLSFVQDGFSRITDSERLSIERRWKGTPIQRMIYYTYGEYVLYIGLGAGLLLLGLVLLAWSLRRRVAARTAELQHAMEELRRSEAQFRLLAENADDVIWTMDLEGRFTYISPSVTKLRGYTPQEAMAQTMEQALSPDSLLLVQGMLSELSRRIRAGVRTFDLPPQEVQQPCKDGSLVWTEVIVTPLFDDAGDFQRLLGITRDISDRRRREEAQRSLEAQMLQAQKLESLGVLAGGIAHDFNNILTSILGNAELAHGDLPADSPARGRINEIEQSSRRAADLCRQMLAYSGRARVSVESVDLSQLVQGMMHMLQVSISKKAVLHSTLPGGLPPVTADATQIRQIVMNLIINASEALGSGTGDISVATGVRDCSAEFLSSCFPGDPLAEGPYAFILVADTGVGMDEATIPRIFDPFFTTKFTGRGLGLAAVLGIVRSHKGAIQVTSAPGNGTTFRVYLPLASSPSAAEEETPGDSPEWKGSGTVLLVDDEETVLAVARIMLERLGLTVITASDGIEALQQFRDHRASISCVILDLTMPRMDGRETFRELRRIAPQVPVAISTGYSEQEATGQFGGDGPAIFILKPFRRAELARALQDLMARPGKPDT